MLSHDRLFRHQVSRAQLHPRPRPPTRYLSQEEVLDQSNPFVQLISGVVWLLRDGQVYINQSLEVECDKTQETGWYSLRAPAGGAGTHSVCRLILSLLQQMSEAQMLWPRPHKSLSALPHCPPSPSPFPPPHPPEGTFRTFVDVVSARTAVGHDAEGRLVLVQLDGQTRQRG